MTLWLRNCVWSTDIGESSEFPSEGDRAYTADIGVLFIFGVRTLGFKLEHPIITCAAPGNVSINVSELHSVIWF